MKKKKLACILLGGLFLMGSLAGCGNGNTVSGKSKEEVKSIFTGRTLEWSEILGS